MKGQNHSFTVDFFALGIMGYEFMLGKRVDHAVNGELTAFSWGDILTVGVPMAAVLTAVWAGYSLIVEHRRKVNTATIK